MPLYPDNVVERMTKLELRESLFYIFLAKENAKRINTAWTEACEPGADDDAAWERISASTNAPAEHLLEYRERLRGFRSWGLIDKPTPKHLLGDMDRDLERLRNRLLQLERTGDDMFTPGQTALSFAWGRISASRANELKDLIHSWGGVVMLTGKSAIRRPTPAEDTAIRAVWATIPHGSSSFSTAVNAIVDTERRNKADGP